MNRSIVIAAATLGAGFVVAPRFATSVLVLAASLVFIFAFPVANNIVKIKLEIRDFKRKSKGLPLIENASLINGHLVNFVLTRHVCDEITRQHKRLGKTFGFMFCAKRAVFSTDLDLIKKLILDEPNKNVNRPEIGWPIEEWNKTCIVQAEGKQWNRMRRAVAPALKSNHFKAPNVVHGIEVSINKLISAIERKLEFVEETQKEKGNESERLPVAQVDIDDLMNRYSMDLVYSCFYKQDNLIDFEKEKDERVEIYGECGAKFNGNPFIILAITFPFLRPIIDWLSMHFHLHGKLRKEIRGFVETQAKQNLAARKQLEQLKASGKQHLVNSDNFTLKNGTQFKRNLMDYITDAFCEHKLNKREYLHNAAFIHSAAYKTAADALAGAIYFLSTNKEIQEKTREAIQAEGTESTYLSWVINETLRLCPPAPTGCSRINVEDIELADGRVIPANTSIHTPLYTIHRLPEYWGEDAEQFKPERFGDAKHFHPAQYMPFGAGVRACPGKEFALFEMKMVLCALLERYKFDGKEKPLKFDSPFLVFIVHDEPTYVRVTRL